MKGLALRVPSDEVRLGHVWLSIWMFLQRTSYSEAYSLKPCSSGGCDNRLEPLPRPSPGRTHRRGDTDSRERRVVHIRQCGKGLCSALVPSYRKLNCLFHGEEGGGEWFFAVSSPSLPFSACQREDQPFFSLSRNTHSR
jgi:hypothetical protein